MSHLRAVPPPPAPPGDSPGLTADERRVLDLLAEAWNAYIKLPLQYSLDRSEFAFYVNGCQGIVGLRVARRADPDVWHNEEERT